MVNLGLILEYEVAFPKENPKELHEYFIGASRERLLKLGSFLLSIKNKDSIYRDNSEALGKIFSKENNTIAQEIYHYIKTHESKTGKKLQIFHPFTSLRLFEFFFKNCNVNIEPEQTTAQFELNFFKAYLILNSQFTKEQGIAFTSVKHLEPKLQIPMMLFCMSYPYSDKINYDISQQWVTQTIKAIFLFEFLDSEQKTKALLQLFLDHFKSLTWKDYLAQYIPLTLTVIKKEKESSTDVIIKQDELFDKQCDFLEKFIIYDGDLQDEIDFLTLRSKPLYKIERGHYRIIYDLFIVEKIHKGLYFVLRDFNSSLPKPEQIKDFKSFYGKNFSESVLTYKALEAIYPDNCIKFSGDEMDKIIDGAPDYYIRRGRDILLFESKDFLIPVKSKDSYDYSVYEEVFQERLYFKQENGRQYNKAIMQIIESIKTILQKTFIPDINYNYREVVIYPILVIHDHQFDAGGLRDLIDSWFKEELELLESQENIFIKRVKPLVIINIDQVLYFQVALSKNISLHRVIDAYFENIRIKPRSTFKSDKEWEAHLLNKCTPFSVFLTNYMLKHKYRELPPMLKEMGLQLFKENT